jgi:HNH endonuclease
MQVLDYCPRTGAFTWRVSTGRVAPGGNAGTLNANGHYHIQLNGKKYPAAQLAWMICHGEMPKANIRHRNGDQGDNRLCNLELSTRSNPRKSTECSAPLDLAVQMRGQDERTGALLAPLPGVGSQNSPFARSARPLPG